VVYLRRYFLAIDERPIKAEGMSKKDSKKSEELPPLELRFMTGCEIQYMLVVSM